MVAPAAPHLSTSAVPSEACIRIIIEDITRAKTATKICSMIWDREVGIIFRYAWKYPRKTPRIPERKMVGESICRASLAPATESGTMTEAPK